jgi:hypothetical protein
MPRTLGDVVTEARRILQDEDTENYRYPDADLYAAITSAIAEVRRLRSDAFIGSITDALPIYTSANSGLAFPIDETFFTPVVYFVAGYAELRDDEFTNDGRAVALMNKFVSQLRVGDA